MKSKIFGILPMAGKGSRIQPIGFSKELYPVVSNGKHFAISEFNIKSMLNAGAQEIKLVVNPDKMDIAKYYSKYETLTSVYFYESPSLPESCLYPIDSLNDEDICLFGLPDTLFSPITAHKMLVNKILDENLDICLGLFKVEDATKYDSVKFDEDENILAVLVKQSPPLSDFIWGVWGAKVRSLKILKKYIQKQRAYGNEKLLGVGFNQLAKNTDLKFKGIKISDKYYDVGTMDSVIKANQVIQNFKLY